MRVPALILLGFVAAGPWACSAASDRDDGSAGTGGAGTGSSGTGGRGGAGSGSSGTGGAGSGGGSTCRALEEASSAVIAEAVDNADLSCTRDDECEVVSNSTDCHAACGALVGPIGKAELQAAVASENAGRCAGFEAMGCVALVPPCLPPPPGIRCAAGRCTSDDEVPSGGSGGGTADAGAPVPGCLDQPLTFGWNGGFVAFSDVITISPCRTFALERTGAGDPSANATCENEIAIDARFMADAVDTALAQPGVRAAFAMAPKLFGVDTRPVDGQVYRIELDGSAIEVGQPCEGGGGPGGACTEIPADVGDLVAVLQSLVDQQSAIPDCDQLP